METISQSISIWIPGIPAPGGSKRFVGFGKKTGRAILIDAAGVKNKQWRSVCADFASSVMSGKPVLMGALRVVFVFHMPRPKGHYGSGKNKGIVRSTAPLYPITKPDALKLARSTEDALTGIVWLDDAQTVSLEAHKIYANGGKSGCMVSIQPMI